MLEDDDVVFFANNRTTSMDADNSNHACSRGRKQQHNKVRENINNEEKYFDQHECLAEKINIVMDIITTRLERYKDAHDYLEITNNKENFCHDRDAKDNHFIIALMNNDNEVIHQEGTSNNNEDIDDDETKKENEIKAILLKNDNKIISEDQDHTLLNYVGFKFELEEKTEFNTKTTGDCKI